MAVISTIHHSTLAAIAWMHQSTLKSESPMPVILVSSVPSFDVPFGVEKICKEMFATAGKLEPYGKSRKPKPAPKPVDPVWQKKRKKLLAALRRKK